MSVSLKKPAAQTYRVVIIYDSGQRAVHDSGLTLATATSVATALENEPHTTAYDVRVEEE